MFFFTVWLYCLITYIHTYMHTCIHAYIHTLVPYHAWKSFMDTLRVSLQLFLVLWIFLKSLGVIFCNRWVFSRGHTNYFNNWCLMNLQPTFLILTHMVITTPMNSWPQAVQCFTHDDNICSIYYSQLHTN